MAWSNADSRSSRAFGSSASSSAQRPIPLRADTRLNWPTAVAIRTPVRASTESASREASADASRSRSRRAEARLESVRPERSATAGAPARAGRRPPGRPRRPTVRRRSCRRCPGRRCSRRAGGCRRAGPRAGSGRRACPACPGPSASSAPVTTWARSRVARSASSRPCSASNRGRASSSAADDSPRWASERAQTATARPAATSSPARRTLGGLLGQGDGLVVAPGVPQRGRTLALQVGTDVLVARMSEGGLQVRGGVLGNTQRV